MWIRERNRKKCSWLLKIIRLKFPSHFCHQQFLTRQFPTCDGYFYVSTWQDNGVPRYSAKPYFRVCLRVFLGEINTGIHRLSKLVCHPQCGWAQSNPIRAWIEQTGRRWKFSFFCLTAWAGIPIFCSQCSWISGLQTQTTIYIIGSPVSWAFGLGLVTPPAFQDLQFANGGTSQPL